MSVEVTLTCRVCGNTRTLAPYFMLTKQGTLRVQASAAGFSVDGAGALCYLHKADPPPAPQAESWTDYDRRSIISELIAEGEPSIVPASEEQQRVAEALSRYTNT